jgi:hypothetical protein
MKTVDFLPEVPSPNKKHSDAVSIRNTSDVYSQHGGAILHGRGLENVRARIKAEFDKARGAAPIKSEPRVESVEIDPNPLGCNLMAAEPSLQKRSAAILRAIPTPLRRQHNGVHDLGEAPKEVDLSKLFDEALKSLGHAKQKS